MSEAPDHEQVAQVIAPVPLMHPADCCDQCGARACLAVKFPVFDVELLFCAPHFEGNEEVIAEHGGQVLIDDRAFLPVEETA